MKTPELNKLRENDINHVYFHFLLVQISIKVVFLQYSGSATQCTRHVLFVSCSQVDANAFKHEKAV